MHSMLPNADDVLLMMLVALIDSVAVEKRMPGVALATRVRAAPQPDEMTDWTDDVPQVEVLTFGTHQAEPIAG